MRFRDEPSVSSNNNDSESQSTTEVTDEGVEIKNFNYFRCLLLTGYYTMAFPFKPVFDPETGEYFAESNRVQKTICYTAWISLLVNRVTSVRRMLDKSILLQTTTSKFHLAHSILHVIMSAVYFKTVLLNSQGILDIIKSSCSATITFSRKSKLCSFLILSQAIWLGFTITRPIMGQRLVRSFCWTADNLQKALLAHGRFTFFIRPSINSTIAEDPATYSTFDIFVVANHFLLVSSDLCITHFIICLFGTCAVVLWANANGFCDAVLKYIETVSKADTYAITVKNCDLPGDSESPFSLMEKYKCLRSVYISVNATWHSMCFWFILDATSLLSTELDSGLRDKDDFLKAFVLYYFVYIGVAMCFSAESFRKIEKLKSTLRNYDKMNSGRKIDHDVEQLLSGLDKEVIGIGEPGFFKLDYALLGKLIGLIVTFYSISADENLKDDRNIAPEGKGSHEGCFVL